MRSQSFGRVSKMNDITGSAVLFWSWGSIRLILDEMYRYFRLSKDLCSMVRLQIQRVDFKARESECGVGLMFRAFQIKVPFSKVNGVMNCIDFKPVTQWLNDGFCILILIVDYCCSSYVIHLKIKTGSVMYYLFEYRVILFTITSLVYL